MGIVMVLPFMEHEPIPLLGIHFSSWRKCSAAISRESVEESFGAFLGAFFYGATLMDKDSRSG